MADTLRSERRAERHVGSTPSNSTNFDMKGKYTQRRIKAQKGSSCAMCKPWKHGWSDKKTINDVRKAVDAEEQVKEI